jgi:hypothetical protein
MEFFKSAKQKMMGIKNIQIGIYIKKFREMLKDTERVKSIATAFGIILIIFFILYSIFLMPVPYEPIMLYPENGSKDVSPNTNLSWIGGNPSDKFIFTITSLYGNKLNLDLVYYITVYNEKGDIYYRGVEVGDSRRMAINHKLSKPLKQGSNYSWEIAAENNLGGLISGPKWILATKNTDEIIFKNKNIYFNNDSKFNWDEIPKNNTRLIDFLKNEAKWVENANIKKEDGGKTINISKDKNILKLNLNDKNEITFKIENKTWKLRAELNQNNTLEVYSISSINVTELENNSINISYDIAKGGVVGVYSIPISNQLHTTKGLMLNYEGNGSPNTVEIKFHYLGDKINYLFYEGDIKTNTSQWKEEPLQIQFDGLNKGYDNSKESLLDPIDRNKVRSVHIAFSNRPEYGDDFGAGWVRVYNVRGIIE